MYLGVKLIVFTKEHGTKKKRPLMKVADKSILRYCTKTKKIQKIE